MRTEKVDGAQERTILTAMIVNDHVLGRIASKWEKGLFRTPYAEDVARECVDYYDTHAKAPGRNIEALMRSWARNHQREEPRVDAVENLLQHVSREYEQGTEDNNPDYILDMAAKHFSLVRMARLAEEINGHVLKGDVERASNCFANFNKLDLSAGSGVDPFNDKEACFSAFRRREQDVLVKYEGALGKLLGATFARDSFVAFSAASKSGKSFWLLDVAFRALCNRKKVAYFQVGDLSEDQILERIYMRAAQHPTEADTWPVCIRIPKEIRFDSKGVPLLSWSRRNFDEPLSPERAWEAMQDTVDSRIKSLKCYFKVYTNFSMNVLGIRDELRNWERQYGFIPDVICVDYADLLLPCNSKLEFRHQINDTWHRLRILSAEKHVCLVTVTQVNTRGFDAKYIKASHFSEDRRKLDHVSTMLGNIATDAEKESQISRVNIVRRRKGKFVESKQVHVGSCLALANPCTCSAYHKPEKRPMSGVAEEKEDD